MYIGHCFMLALPCILLTANDPSVQAVIKRTQDRYAAMNAQFKQHIQAKKNPRDFHPDFTPALKEIEDGLKTAPKGSLREALLVSKFKFGMRGALPREEMMTLEKLLLQEVPGRSVAWSIEPEGFLLIATPAMIEDALAANPEPAVKAQILGSQGDAALKSGKIPEAKTILARLEKDFPKAEVTEQLRDSLQDVLATLPGTAAPAFNLPDLKDPKLIYTLESFKGKYLLLDFWATWCGPCRGEMPHLHKAWERFKGKNFEILSLSFDRKASDVAPFRSQAGTPMPWKHAFVAGGFQSPLGKAYNVSGIPKPLLVGPDGTFVASGDELRGEGLEKVLEKYLK